MEQQKKLNKIVNGKVVSKPSTLKEIKRSFFTQDKESIKHYVIFELIVPSIKRTILDTLSVMFDMKTTGAIKSTIGSSAGNLTYIAYNKASEKPKASAVSENRPTFDSMVFESSNDAQEVLNALVDIIEDYGMVKIADLYDLVGWSIGNDYTLNNYGWTNLQKASVVRVNGGYQLTLPKARDLN